jgi:hypothetical protein
MLLTILHAHRDRCGRCVSPLSKAGFVVADVTGRRAFLCTGHLDELLDVCRMPPRTDRNTAGNWHSPMEEEVGVAS